MVGMLSVVVVITIISFFAAKSVGSKQSNKCKGE
jgi:hypothetical protein